VILTMRILPVLTSPLIISTSSSSWRGRAFT